MAGRSLGLIAGIAALTAVALPTARAQTVTVTGAQRTTALASHLRSTSTGTLHLKGTLGSTVGLTMTGAFSVGHTTNLSWDLPAVTSVHVAGYWQTVERISYAFNIAPDSSQDVVINGAPVHRVAWKAPPANTALQVSEYLQIQVRSKVGHFHSKAHFPLKSVPGYASPFLATTPATQLPASAQKLVSKLAHGKHSERRVVVAITNWVASHTRYAYTSLNSAAEVLTRHAGTCEGYTNLTIAMLRSLGIPAQASYGWVTATPIELRDGRGRETIQWSRPGSGTELHAWLNVYFPRSGWVPFDPQLEKFFIDPRHILIKTAVDASNMTMGAWSADGGNGSVTGRNLSNGYPLIVPGTGQGSSTTVHTIDSFRASVGSMVNDVSRVVLFSR
jgi:Transglutaminase-like superfamily